MKALMEHPQAWTRVDAILETSSSPNSKFFALQARGGRRLAAGAEPPRGALSGTRRARPLLSAARRRPRPVLFAAARRLAGGATAAALPYRGNAPHARFLTPA